MGFNRPSVEKFFSLITETMEICMSASGAFMPPSFIFPRARAKPELLDDAPPEPAETTNRSIQGERNDNRLPEPRNSPPRTPPTSLPRSPLRKPPNTTPIPTEQFYANSTPSCSHTTQNFVITPQQLKFGSGGDPNSTATVLSVRGEYLNDRLWSLLVPYGMKMVCSNKTVQMYSQRKTMLPLYLSYLLY
ncbi:hypothetical protein QE152_g22040 [Popillia japonica]|uniref:Uncharacterized protein n=1 Tax=Popillia japonica TaxID=7064 RepID=A0AAW1KM10_POPJA